METPQVPEILENFTGEDVVLGGVVIKKDHRPLFLKAVKTRPRMTSAHVEVYDATFEVPDLSGVSATGIIVPSLTAMLLSGEVSGRLGIYYMNTNPGYITRDSAGIIVPGSCAGLLRVCGAPGPRDPQGPPGPPGPQIHDVHVLLPHPVHIVDAAGNMTRTLCASGDPGRSEFVETSQSRVLTECGEITVFTGFNEIPRFKVPQTSTHDGILVSANLFGILRTHGVVGDRARMVAAFGRDDFSLLLVDNDAMVRDKSTGRIIGTQNLLCVAAVL